MHFSQIQPVSMEIFHLPNETSQFKIAGIQKKSKLFPFESAFVVSYDLYNLGTSSLHFLLLGLWSLLPGYPLDRSS